MNWKKKILLISICCLCAGSLLAAEVLKNGDFKNGGDGWRLLRQGTGRDKRITTSFEHGRFTLNLPDECIGLNGNVQLLRTLSLDPAKEYRIEYTVTRKTPGAFMISFRSGKMPRVNLGLAKVTELSPGTSKHVVFLSPAPLPDKNNYSELCFQIGGMPGKTEIANISVRENITERPEFGSSYQVFLNDPGTYSRIPSKPSAVLDIPFRAVPGYPHKIDFRKLGVPAGNRRTAVVFTEFNSDRDKLVRCGFSSDWFMNIYLNGESVYSTMEKGNGSNSFSTSDHTVDLPVRKGRNLLAVKVRSGADGWRLIWGLPEKPVTYEAGDTWKPVPTNKLHIKTGSALDLSGMIDAPAGKYGRAKVGKTGLLEFEKQPGKTVRLHGFSSFIPEDVWRDCPDSEFRALADRFAKATRRQGYNLFRMHGLDQWIMLDSKKDAEFSKKFLDRWDYLISAFKKEGIYVQYVVFSFNLYSKGADYQKTFRKRNMHKMRLFMGGEFEMERFRLGATRLLNHVNPYTKLAWKDDPAIVLVEYYNEEYLGMGRYTDAARQFPEDHQFVLSVWNKWLANRYASVPLDRRPEPLRRIGIGKIEIPSPGSPLINDYSIFCWERIKATSAWCDRVIREAGYPGLTTQNCALQLNSAAAGWETLQVTDNHIYYCHPSDWANPGSIVGQKSAVELAAGYFRNLAAGRLAGRPQFVGEFNFCFWNPYQHEAGLVFNAYAAYQNFSGLAIHSHPVLGKGGNYTISNFSSGSNPVLRAAQFLSNMFFLRGDVKPSPHLVTLTVPRSFLETNGNGLKAVSSEQSKLALLSGFSIAFPWAPLPEGTTAGRVPDMAILPSGASGVETHGWYSKVIESRDAKFSLDRTVLEMKKRGILSPDNISTPSKGIFQSDTGEITLRSREKLMKVVTPKTEAVSMTAGNRETLGVLTVRATSSDACIAVTSVDGRPLTQSRRMVLVYSTEMVNTGMSVGGGRARLVKLGRAPILMRTGTLSLALAGRGNPGWKLYALNLVGERTESLPVAYSDSSLRIELDTRKLKDGNTPFFELVLEP